MDFQRQWQRASAGRHGRSRRCADCAHRCGQRRDQRPLANGRAARGVALIEAIVAITLVAIAAATILAQIARANVNSGRNLLQSQAAAVAALYLTEITARPFSDPDGADGETQRRFFDDVDDYRGLNDAAARDASGTVLPGGNRFRVTVAVANSGALSGVPAADALLVTVRVTDQVGGTVTASAYRLRP